MMFVVVLLPAPLSPATEARGLVDLEIDVPDGPGSTVAVAQSFNPHNWLVGHVLMFDNGLRKMIRAMKAREDCDRTQSLALQIIK